MEDSFLQNFTAFFKSYLYELIATAGQPYFILSTLAIMIAIYFRWRWKQGIDGIGFKDAMSFLFPKHIYKHKSAIIGYKFLLIDPLIRLFFFTPAMQVPIIAFVFVKTQELLANGLGSPGYDLNLHELNPILFAIGFTGITALLRDLGYYIQHVLMHKIPFFWEFHKVHHSAEVLTPITDWRIHPLDLLSIPYFIGILLGVLQGVLDYFLTSDLTVLSILGLNVILFGYYAVGYHFRHSHLRISFGKYISHVIMSPVQHHIHHSTDSRHFDKNFGSAFSFWDWVFGTLYIPQKNEELAFGLSHQESGEYNSLWRMYTLPFTKNIKAGRMIQVVLLVGVLAFFAITTWVTMVKELSVFFNG